MVNLLNKIIENNVIFGCVIGGLCLVLIILVVLIVRSIKENRKINVYEEELEDEDIKKVKNVKKEDIIEEPDFFDDDEEDEIIVERKKEEPKKELFESIDDSEIEERYSREKEKEINEVKEENHNEQLQKILEKMEKDSKLSPEDVVANFEKEQEAQSIISYTELVNAVKNRNDDYYDDELEEEPLTTVTEFLKQKDEQEPIDFSDFTTVINTIHEKQEDGSFEVEDRNSCLDDLAKFKKTEVISPIYGRVSQSSKEVDYAKTIDLRDLDLSDNDFSRERKEERRETIQDDSALSALDDVYMKMADKIINKKEEKGETTSLDALARNEEFLQSLKDFRKNL